MYSALREKFAPEAAEEIEACMTVAGMKSRMRLHARNNAVLHAADTLNYQGAFANEADKYAWISYQLLLQNEKMLNTMLEWNATTHAVRRYYIDQDGVLQTKD